MKNLIICFFLTTLLSGCATFYRPINSQEYAYANRSSTENLNYAYSFEVLQNTGNPRYERKADKHGIKIMAIQIENKTSKSISVSDDLRFFLGEREVIPVQPQRVYRRIKQGFWGYLLYSPVLLYIQSGSSETIIPIGIGIAAANLTVAGLGNNTFRTEFKEDNIAFKDIPPGQKLNGLIGFQTSEIGNFRIELRTP